ncbi:type II toxin-antitoxin system RelE/ParE family toxin [Erwinia pyrifoliae]|uniref:type II toxin-antitoxin system RelE/ParE family toxin n=1 Tax=Erwinia pyrifoliae TaxID=79967 RepID=UPI0021D7AE00|nr:type II toxin-antitoxin system RelE/ParE family toxin [Erwinia pyrifoliae]MCU8586120.1 type II toxin-antitoxin system RelE/ParE family toxin [Erwinia pyrifoliae]
MGKFTLTDDAKEDMKEMRAYSVQQWNKEVAKVYLEGMRLTMQMLANHPDIGDDVSDRLGAGVRSWLYQSHHLYIVSASAGVTAIGILHQTRLPSTLKKREISD